MEEIKNERAIADIERRIGYIEDENNGWQKNKQAINEEAERQRGDIRSRKTMRPDLDFSQRENQVENDLYRKLKPIDEEIFRNQQKITDLENEKRRLSPRSGSPF